MLTRRKALAVLGTAGIGTSVLQRALAAKAASGPFTPQMVAEAEWVAGIALTPAQLTGWGQEDDRQRTRQAGFDHHLLKPPDLTALRSFMMMSPRTA
jgi:hypothetical protein